jgi:hypothetical protein
MIAASLVFLGGQRRHRPNAAQQPFAKSTEKIITRFLLPRSLPAPRRCFS